MSDVCVTGGQGDTDQVWCELAATPEEILWNWTHWSHMQRTRRTAVEDNRWIKMQGTDKIDLFAAADEVDVRVCTFASDC